MRNTARTPVDPSAAPAAEAGGAFIERLPDDAFGHEALSLAEQSAGIGVWSIDLATGLVRATAQFFRTMGLEPTTDRVPISAIRALRPLTNSTLNKEPKWRHTGAKLTTGYQSPRH